MRIEYSDDRKHAFFNGETFTRDNKTGYYLVSANGRFPGRRLHRAVWEYYNGEIPEGYDIHHIDHDKSNNEVENLRMLKRQTHREIHQKELSDDERKQRRENMIKNVIPAAAEWHHTQEGIEWHRIQYQRTKDKFRRKSVYICENCGKQYEAEAYKRNKFCSNACKSAWRRKSGIDDEERICAVCGKSFAVNKYSKTKTCSAKCASAMRRRTET